MTSSGIFILNLIFNHYTLSDEIDDPFPNFITSEVWNDKMNSSHTWLGLRLLIRAGIKLTHVHRHWPGIQDTQPDYLMSQICDPTLWI